jgi:hypothetical protein
MEIIVLFEAFAVTVYEGHSKSNGPYLKKQTVFILQLCYSHSELLQPLGMKCSI